VAAARLIGGLGQAFDFEAIQTIDAAPTSSGRCQGKLAADVLDDVLGLVIAEAVLTPQPRRVTDDRGKAGVGLRVRRMTAHSGPIRQPPRDRERPNYAENCAVRAVYAVYFVSRAVRVLLAVLGCFN